MTDTRAGNVALVAVATCIGFAPTALLAQTDTPSLKINASIPQEIDQRRTRQGGASAFRIMFRILTSSQGEVPFTTLYRMNGELAGWSAYTSGAAQCRLYSGDSQGVDVFIGNFGNDQDIAQLQNARTSSSVAHPVRPTIMRADFVCDERIGPGDTATVQARFFALSNGRWRVRDVTFRDLAIAAQQADPADARRRSLARCTVRAAIDGTCP